MAQNITLMGASYSAVPSVTLPKTGGGTASFTDVSDTTATAADVASGTYFYTAAGVRTEGTSSGGGGGGGTEYVISASQHPILNTSGFDLSSAGLTASDVAIDGNTLVWVEATSSFTMACWLDSDDDNEFSVTIPSGTKFACAATTNGTYAVHATFVGNTSSTYGFFNMSADKSDDFFIHQSYGDNPSEGGFVRSLSFKAQNGVPTFGFYSYPLALHIIKFS